MNKLQKLTPALVAHYDLIVTELELRTTDGSWAVQKVWMEREVYKQRTPPGRIVVWDYDTWEYLILNFTGQGVTDEVTQEELDTVVLRRNLQ